MISDFKRILMLSICLTYSVNVIDSSAAVQCTAKEIKCLLYNLTFKTYNANYWNLLDMVDLLTKRYCPRIIVVSGIRVELGTPWLLHIYHNRITIA